MIHVHTCNREGHETKEGRTERGREEGGSVSESRGKREWRKISTIPVWYGMSSYCNHLLYGHVCVVYTSLERRERK